MPAAVLRRPAAVWPLVLAARNGLRQGLAYRAAHMIKNLASVIFGVVYIAIWEAALRSPGAAAAAGAAGIGPVQMAHYVAVSQCLMWLTTFLPVGLGIPAALRTGQVTADLMRPVAFWPLQMAREAGGCAYSLVFRTLPMAAVFALLVGFPLPPHPLIALAAVLLAVWNALCLAYLVGISAFWLTEARSMHWLLQALIFNVGGGIVPLSVYPGALRTWLPRLPFASLLNTPALAWMGQDVGGALVIAAAWALALAGLCLLTTARARRRVVIQGG